MDSSSIDRAGSLIVAAVEQTWASLQNRHPEVPGVVVTFGAGTIGSAPGTVRLGHFAPARWAVDANATETPVHELFIGGEGLARGPVNLLGTLLHEAAHALAHARGIQDTSRQGRYHNGRYKAVAEELGIEVAQVGAIGWSDTTVPTPTVDAYTDEVTELSHAIRAYRRAEGGVLITGGSAGEDDGQDGDSGEEAAKKRRNGVSAICQCHNPRRIRVALSVWEAGPITCGICSASFYDPTEDEAGEDTDGENQGEKQGEGW